MFAPLFVPTRVFGLVLVLCVSSCIGAPPKPGDAFKSAARAISRQRNWELARLLDADPELVRQTSRSKSTLLHLAALDHNAGAVKLLLERGADPDGGDAPIGSPLEQAAMFGDLEIGKLLVAAGADVNHRYVIRDSKSGEAISTGFSVLENAVYHGHLELVRFLFENGVKPDLRYGSLSILHTACQPQVRDDRHPPSNREIIEFLISRGQDINGQNAGGETPLMAAIERSAAETVEYLLSRGDVELNAVSKLHQTALDLALERLPPGERRERIIKALLAKGAQPAPERVVKPAKRTQERRGEVLGK